MMKMGAMMKMGDTVRLSEQGLIDYAVDEISWRREFDEHTRALVLSKSSGLDVRLLCLDNFRQWSAMSHRWEVVDVG